MNPNSALGAVAAVSLLLLSWSPFSLAQDNSVRQPRAFKPISSSKTAENNSTLKQTTNQFGFMGVATPTQLIAASIVEPPVPTPETDVFLDIPMLTETEIGRLESVRIPPPPLEAAILASTRSSGASGDQSASPPENHPTVSVDGTSSSSTQAESSKPTRTPPTPKTSSKSNDSSRFGWRFRSNSSGLLERTPR